MSLTDCGSPIMKNHYVEGPFQPPPTCGKLSITLVQLNRFSLDIGFVSTKVIRSLIIFIQSARAFSMSGAQGLCPPPGKHKLFPGICCNLLLFLRQSLIQLSPTLKLQPAILLLNFSAYSMTLSFNTVSYLLFFVAADDSKESGSSMSELQCWQDKQSLGILKPFKLFCTPTMNH